jgi:O-antigen/teichoic acid export membrane protein
MKKNKYLISSVWYIVANSLGLGIYLLSNIIFTRIMPQQEYGLYSTYYSVVTILVPFVGMNLFVGLTNGYIDFSTKKEEFRGAVFFLSIIVFCIFLSFISPVKKILNNYFKINISSLLMILALIHAYSFFVVNYYSTYLNMENAYKIKSLFLFLPNLLQVFLPVVIILALKKDAFFERVIGSSLGVLLCALFPIFRIIQKWGKTINYHYYKYALSISVPSILSSISYMIMQHSDQVMITFFIGAKATAVYSLVFLLGNALYGILQAVSGAFQSWIYRVLGQNENKDILIVQKWILLFFLFISYFLLMIAPEIIKILSPKPYWDFRYIPPFLAGSFILVINNLYSHVGTFFKKTGKLSLCVFIAAAINIILNYYYVPRFGAIAAAYTSLVSYIVLVSLNYVLVKIINKNVYSERIFLLFVILMIIGCIIFMLVGDNILLRYIVYLSILFFMSLYGFCHRKEVLGVC